MIIWIRFIEKMQQKFEKLLVFLGAVFTIFLMFLITLDVILRKFGSPIQGAYELVQLLTVGIVFLGVAYVQRIKGHVFIEVATDKFPKKVQQGLDFFGYIVGFAVCLIITWQSGITAWESFLTREATSGMTKIPIWPVKIVILMGMGLLTLRLILDIVYYLFPKVPINQPNTQMNGGVLQVDKPNMQIKDGEEIWH
ncbi:TRAP transporter small permease [Neobacillus niacini]|uniref:TRAP transporter small permease subunit n=1 Tax=Neobacillus niacini TaxID=86668 RepID=UPI002FFE92E2